MMSTHQQTIGWNFTANQTLHVADVEWYEPTGTNLAQHDVDVWTNTGNTAEILADSLTLTKDGVRSCHRVRCHVGTRRIFPGQC